MARALRPASSGVVDWAARRRRVFHYMLPPTALAFWLLRDLRIISPVPVWVLGAALGGSYAISKVVDRSYQARPDRLHFHMHLASDVLGSTVVMYATGWGAMLAIGYVVAVHDTTAAAGSRAWKASSAWCVAGIFAGQLGIALGLVPTEVPQPAVHGLAVLVALGLVFAFRFVAVTTAEKERAESELRHSEDRFRSLVQHSSDVVAVIDGNMRINYVSDAIERLTGFASEHYFGMNMFEFVHPEDTRLGSDFLDSMLAAPGASATVEIRCRNRSGEWRWVEATVTNHLQHPNVCGLVANLHDITERRLLAARLQFGAYHDALTGLPNRRAFLERLERSLALAARGGPVVAVLFCDLDRFKVVNDSLGHVIGDGLLVAVARRLSRAVRACDYVARFAGDEFAVLLEDAGQPLDAVAGAERVLECLRSSLLLGGRDLKVSASIGIALSGNGAGPADLLRQADLAMYAAKERGGGAWALFDSQLEERAVERMSLEAELWRAVDGGELVTYYQPEVDLETGLITGAEALVRWNHPDRGLVGPDDFVPIAEESDLILSIDRTVLGQAAAAIAQWRRLGLPPSFVVSVNLSSRWFREVERLSELAAVVARNGATPHDIRLEITERVALGEGQETAEAVGALRRYGFRIAIDDFGTGYSSMAYLSRFRVDALKLDRSFVDRIDRSEGDAAIVRAMVTIGHALGSRLVAEGVERPDQAQLLRAWGCQSAQGFLFSEALPAEEAASMLLSGGLLRPVGAV